MKIKKKIPVWPVWIIFVVFIIFYAYMNILQGWLEPVLFWLTFALASGAHYLIYRINKKNNHVKEYPEVKKGRVWRFFFWFFIISSIAYLSNNIKDLRSSFETDKALWLGSTIGVIVWPFVCYYFGFYYIHKKGIKVKYKQAFAYLAVVFLFFLILPSLSTIIKSTKELTCRPPKVLILNKCCIPEPDTNNRACADDVALAQQSMLESVEKKKYSNGSILIHKDPPFSFQSPNEYLYAENLKIVNIPAPYVFTARGKNESDVIEIDILYIEGKVDTENLMDDYLKGLNKGVAKSGIKVLGTKEITTRNNLRGVATEAMDDTLDQPYYMKAVMIPDKERGFTYLIRYTSSLGYKAYVEDADVIVESFKLG